MVLPNNGKHTSSCEVDQMNGTREMQIDMQKDRQISCYIIISKYFLHLLFHFLSLSLGLCFETIM